MAGDTALVLTRGELASLLARARAAGPEECCGVLIGRELGPGTSRVIRTQAAANAWAGDRTRRYEIPPETLLAAMKAAREEDLEVIGYYHSHPRGAARPSAFDRERAWPDLSYLILAPGADPPARSFRLGESGEFREERLTVEDAGLQ